MVLKTCLEAEKMKFEITSSLDGNKCRICGKPADKMVLKGFFFILSNVETQYYCDDCLIKRNLIK